MRKKILTDFGSLSKSFQRPSSSMLQSLQIKRDFGKLENCNEKRKEYITRGALGKGEETHVQEVASSNPTAGYKRDHLCIAK